jgi:two-component system, NarL family, response regulator LiaR
MGKIGILIADDHKLIRQGIINFLEVHGEFEVKGEAENGEEAVKLAGTLRPDIILMDINMPKKNGLEAIREIKKSLPEIKIIVLTVFTQAEMVLPAINAGVDGYLLKDIMPNELIAAIHSVLDGKPALHPDIVKKLMLGLTSQNNQIKKMETLTVRENEIFNLLGEGKSNEEIANVLMISVLTVKTHVHNILSKMNMTSRVQAALFAANQQDIFKEEQLK